MAPVGGGKIVGCLARHQRISGDAGKELNCAQTSSGIQQGVLCQPTSKRLHYGKVFVVMLANHFPAGCIKQLQAVRRPTSTVPDYRCQHVEALRIPQ